MTRGFIDIHHHLLHGVDDGSQSLNMSLRMAKRAYEAGTRVIVATPHVTPGVERIPEETFQQRLEELRAACAKERMELRILLGAEILYTDMTCRLLAEGRVPTLAGTEYVLVEFMPGVRYDALNKTLRVSRRNAAHFRSFLCTQGGYGTVTLKDGKVTLDVVSGKIEVDAIVWDD